MPKIARFNVKVVARHTPLKLSAKPLVIFEHTSAPTEYIDHGAPLDSVRPVATDSRAMRMAGTLTVSGYRCMALARAVGKASAHDNYDAGGVVSVG